MTSSTDSASGTGATAGAPGDTMMQAIVQDRYGGPEVLGLAEVAKPAVGDAGVLLRVRAASVNPYDWHLIRGLPYMVRAQAGLRVPKIRIPGVDVSGVVVAVGPDVTEFAPGDEVFGGCAGAFAEYVVGREPELVHKPANVTFEQAAAVGIAGYTALQALRDTGALQSGQRVLVNGASGGVGTFAVQIAGALGADVTAVCSTRNVDLVRSIGADRVIDYTRDDYTTSDERYDLILDTVGTRSMADNRRLLHADGRYVSVGQVEMGDWIGPLTYLAKVAVASRTGSQKMSSMLAKRTKADLVVLAGMLESGEVTPVIDRVYSLAETGEAVGYVEEGHARGKVVVTP